jgi:hypothetical protein
MLCITRLWCCHFCILHLQAKSPKALRELFATILAFNTPSEPLALWERFKDDLAEDFLHAARRVSVLNFRHLPPPNSIFIPWFFV